MKFIVAVIRPAVLGDVRKSLREHKIYHMTILEAVGYGSSSGTQQVFRGQEFPVNRHERIEIQIACRDEMVQSVVDAIIKGARSDEGGEIGDGKIFIMDMPECVEIRTGNKGEDILRGGE